MCFQEQKDAFNRSSALLVMKLNYRIKGDISILILSEFPDLKNSTTSKYIH